MPYPYEQIFAADESAPEKVATNGVVTIFAPGDTTQTPLTITTLTGLPLSNPMQVNDAGFGPAFMHATLDQVAWAGGGFTGLFVSYKGMKDEAVAARRAAEAAAQDAGAPTDAMVDRGIVRADIPGKVAEAVAADATVSAAAEAAIGTALQTSDLVRGSDGRLPSHEENAGLSVALTDARGNRTHLEADDVNGGPTEFSLSLTGPALRDYMDFVTSDDERMPDTQDVPGLSVAVADARGRMTWIRADDTTGGPPPETVEILREALALGAGTAPAYVSAGDSITQGGHGGGPNWQTVLANLLGVPVANTGVSGCTALEIAIKQGSWAPVLTVTDGVLPADGTKVAVTLDNMPAHANWWSAEGQPARTYNGTFEGVPAVLTKNKDNTWTLHRTAAGTTVETVPRTPFLVISGGPSATWILWPGRNDYPKSNMREAVDRMARWIRDGGGHFLILSTLTRTGDPVTYGDTKEVLEQNRITQEAYPREFVNVREFLVRHGLKTAGVVPTEADLAAQAVGGLPPSLMFDTLHPNEAGRRAIGIYIYQQLKARNLA